MRGHEPLRTMRRRGVRPGVVFIDLVRQPSEWPLQWSTECPHRAHVEILDDEMLSGLDLRFCVGMQVLVQGEAGRRVAQVAEACIEAGAARVVAVTTESEIVRGASVAISAAVTEHHPVAPETTEGEAA
jgi:hypothetical protein